MSNIPITFPNISIAILRIPTTYVRKKNRHYIRTHTYVRTIQSIKSGTPHLKFITTIMNSINKPFAWTSSLSIDEVVPSEVENLCDLLNAILLELVSIQVGQLRTKKCCGCEVNHPTRLSHDDYR